MSTALSTTQQSSRCPGHPTAGLSPSRPGGSCLLSSECSVYIFGPELEKAAARGLSWGPLGDGDPPPTHHGLLSRTQGEMPGRGGRVLRSLGCPPQTDPGSVPRLTGAVTGEAACPRLQVPSECPLFPASPAPAPRGILWCRTQLHPSLAGSTRFLPGGVSPPPPEPPPRTRPAPFSSPISRLLFRLTFRNGC